MPDEKHMADLHLNKFVTNWVSAPKKELSFVVILKKGYRSEVRY